MLTSELPSERLNEDKFLDMSKKKDAQVHNAASLQDFRLSKPRSDEFENLSSYRSKQYHDVDEGKNLIV